MTQIEKEKEAMSNTLKPCPFCGEDVEDTGRFVLHPVTKSPCPLKGESFGYTNWKTRVVEDALNVKILELQSEITTVKTSRDLYQEENRALVTENERLTSKLEGK